VQLYVKRDDLIDPVISGNKWRKLKYHLQGYKESGLSQILSFGGAYSNHLHALARVGMLEGIETIGIVRGDELTPQSNETLKDLEFWGMKLHFVSREQYKRRYDNDYIETLRQQYGDFYCVPEGGYSEQAVLGVEDIIAEVTNPYTFQHIFCPVGSGTTLAGLAVAAAKFMPQARIHGICALKNGSYLNQQVESLIQQRQGDSLTNWQLHLDYHFGGFAKQKETFKQLWNIHCIDSQIPWDKVYTAKMLFAVLDMVQQGYFNRGENILLIHTGGLQGNRSVLLKKA